MIVAAAGVIGVLLLLARYLSLWLQAYVTGTGIKLLTLFLMSLRKVNPEVIVRSKVMAVQAGLTTISTNAIEAQYLAGGDVPRIMLALISAQRANIALDWDTAAAIDLAGRDILEAVQISVNPKVINCPIQESEGLSTLDGFAKDGIQLKVRALVTVRTNLLQLVGGATEATVIARVGQGIISAIGACGSYREILADPGIISRQVLAQGLDSQTSFEIVSIDIADIDIGDNIGARLQLDQANADIRIALAFSEKRRAMAVARQQEMVALTKEHEAQLVLEESKIPSAVAFAFRDNPLRSSRVRGKEKRSYTNQSRI
ncbi:flotillin-like FloA family protein [Polystyrenella longa]|nr:flotillin-like FloA family protein [Polystyrenella longa]